MDKPVQVEAAPVAVESKQSFSPAAIGWLLALLATVAFSLATPIARGIILEGAHPTGVLVARLVLAMSLHGVTLALTNRQLLVPGRRCAVLALGAGIVNGVGMVFYFWALTRLDASIAVMLLATSPLVVLSLLTLRGERVTRRHAVRVALALAGVYLLIGPGGTVDFIGVGLVLLTVLVFASQLVMAQWFLKPYEARSITFYTNLGMLVLVSLAWIGQGMAWTPLTPTSWIGVLVLAVVSTFLSRWAMYSAVAHIGSAQMSLLTPLEILLAVIWAILFLGERLALLHWIGGSLILLSALLAIQRINLARHRPRWRVWVRS